VSEAAPASPAQPNEQLAHSPTAGATPTDNHDTFVVKPDAKTAIIKHTTVHNWVELVYRAFGFDLPTAATELAILGVREASLQGKPTTATNPKTKKTTTTSETNVDVLEAGEGSGDSDVQETRTARSEDLNTSPTAWGDLLFVTYTSSTPAAEQGVEVFECTIDAGFAENDANGLPITLEGKLYAGCDTPGTHGAYAGSHICMHLFDYSYGKEGKISLARDATKHYRTLDDIASAKVNPTATATRWLFCHQEDNSSIHMHFGGEGALVHNWSSGCTVLHHHYFVVGSKTAVDPKATRYKRFKDLFNGASNHLKIPYLVVSSKYVRSYEEWVKYLDTQPDDASKPESVIMKDQLKSPEGYAGEYLPSFMTEAFVTAVKALAADPKTPKAAAANLLSSLELAMLQFAQFGVDYIPPGPNRFA
jgi:hypothetical protein